MIETDEEALMGKRSRRRRANETLEERFTRYRSKNAELQAWIEGRRAELERYESQLRDPTPEQQRTMAEERAFIEEQEASQNAREAALVDMEAGVSPVEAMERHGLK